MKLMKGDKVAFVAPSCYADLKDLEKSLEWFKVLGLEVEIMSSVSKHYRYMAGCAKERAADINLAFARSDIKALFCVRGGAGCLGILDQIDYDLVKKNPKPIFGLSDSTALQNALYSRAQNISYTGFLPVFDFKNGSLNAQIEQSLLNIFNGQSYLAKSGKTLVNGKVEGIVVGGCLSVLCQLCGTPFFPDLEDKILLIEDVGEKTYRLESMLNQLRLQKNFAKIKGIVFGQFRNCVEADAGDGTVDEILEGFVKDLNVPVLAHFDYGHEANRYVLPIGGKMVLDADLQEVLILEN